MSLAEISNLSVLSLPISYNELWNPKHYTTAHESHDPAYSSAASAIYPLNTQGIGTGVVRVGSGSRWMGGIDMSRFNSPALTEGK